MKTISKIVLGGAFTSIGIGILLIIIGMNIGYKDSKDTLGTTYSYYSQEDEVKSIHIDLSYGKILFKEADQFSIEASNIYKDSVTSIVDGDGNWTIKEIEDSKHFVHVFAWDIPIYELFHGDLDDYAPDIVITVPKGFQAEEFVCDIGAGRMEFERVNAKRTSVEVGAGSLTIDHLETTEFKAECGVGSINAKGIIKGDAWIECDVGEISLKLKGQEEDFNYKFDCGLGEINVNDYHYSFSKNDTIKHANAKATFDLDCGIGRLDVSIN